MFKKVLPVIVTLSVIVAAIGATAGVAFAAGVNLPADAISIASTAFGREGFFSRNTAFAGDVAVSKFPRVDIRSLAGVKFLRTILALEPSASKKAGDKLASPAFVFFDLNKSQMRMFKDKLLHIYFLASNSNTWKPLGIFLTNGKNGEEATARVSGYGWYALGETK